MKTNLMIVESPVKIPTIKKYLNQISETNTAYKDINWDVMATIGHFMKLKNVGPFDCGYDKGSKSIQFEVDKRQTYSRLKNLKDYDTIYIATDLDNEGEGIGFHCRTVIPKKAYKEMIRIGFDEISKEAIEKSLISPRGWSKGQEEAYKYRAVGDKLIGFYGSKRLFNVLGREYSTGRIQADVILLSGKWENDLKNYKPDLRDRVKLNANGVSGFVYNQNGSVLETKEPYKGTFKIETISISETKYSSKYEVQPFVMTDIVSKYIHKYSSNAIANALQNIKDMGLITYHRTDNPKMEDEFYYKNKDIITKFLELYHLNANTYKYKTGSEDLEWVNKQKQKGKEPHLAHSGIRTINPLKEVDSTKLNKMEMEIYNTIKEQTISFFCAPNEYENIEVKLVDERNNYVNLTFRNYTKINVYKDRDLNKEIRKYDFLKDLKKGDNLAYELENVQIDVGDKPKVLNDTNLIKRLDEIGVGTPATIHSFIPISRTKGVIKKDKPFLEEKGWNIYNEFMSHSKEYFFANVDFTKNEFEKNIRAIEEQRVNLNEALEKLIDMTDLSYERSKSKTPSYKVVDKKCPCCNQKQMIKESSKKNGMVLFCKGSKINAKENECKYEFIPLSEWNKHPLEIKDKVEDSLLKTLGELSEKEYD